MIRVISQSRVHLQVTQREFSGFQKITNSEDHPLFAMEKHCHCHLIRTSDFRFKYFEKLNKRVGLKYCSQVRFSLLLFDARDQPFTDISSHVRSKLKKNLPSHYYHYSEASVLYQRHQLSKNDSVTISQTFE